MSTNWNHWIRFKLRKNKNIILIKDQLDLHLWKVKEILIKRSLKNLTELKWMEDSCMEALILLLVEYCMSILEYLRFIKKYLPVTNLPPLEIVPPVITNPWFCYFPTTSRFDALTRYVVPLPHAIPKSWRGLL